jgi:hypothetical protein
MTTATKPKPEAVYYLFGHCRLGTVTELDGVEYHADCPGAISNASAGTTSGMAYCNCQCHADVPRCSRCRRTGTELTLTNDCVDIEDCMDDVTRRAEANPVHQTLRQILEEQRIRAAEQSAARREQRIAEGQPVRTRKEPPTPKRCHCGCEGMTKGGIFVAGHDARLKGWLIKTARMTNGGNDGKGVIKSDAIRAMAELIARNWPRKGVDATIERDAEMLVAEYGPERLIDQSVTDRYAGRGGGA